MRSYFSGVMREFQEKSAVKSRGYISMKHPVQHFTCRCSQRLLDQYLRRFQCRHKGLADASRVLFFFQAGILCFQLFSKLFGLLERNRCGSTWIKILVGILTTSTQMFHSFTVSSGHAEKITPPLQILPFHLEKWDIFKVTCFSNFPMNVWIVCQIQTFGFLLYQEERWHGSWPQSPWGCQGSWMWQTWH